MKVCFVGAGSIGKRHIINLHLLMKEKNISLEIHLLKKTNRVIKEEINSLITKIVNQEDDLDEWYDAIFVTNPTNLHYHTLCSLKDKADYFFIEKPVFDAMNLDVSVFQKKNKVYYVACPLRYTKVLLYAKAVLDVAKVKSVRAISSSYLPKWRPGTDYRDTYSAHAAQGGGVRIDLIHEWDYLTYLFGMPLDVKYMYGKYSNLDIDSEDIAIYIAKYENKLVELHLDYFGSVTRRTCEILTDNELYVFDISNNCVIKNGVCIKSFNEAPNDKYLEELKYFMLLMMGEEKNSNDIFHALDIMRIAYGLQGER